MSRYVRQEKSQRKHPVASSANSLLKPAVVPSAIKEKPGWKGPGFIKKAPKQPPNTGRSKISHPAAAVQRQWLPLALQQLLLNVLRTSLPVCQDYETLKPMLQDVRIAISEGDFEKAFSRQEWLEAYAVRWSSVRALCCATVLVEFFNELQDEIWVKNLLGGEDIVQNPPQATSFGGGATEILAFAAALRYFRFNPTDQHHLVPTDVTSQSMESLQKDGTSLTSIPHEQRLHLQLCHMADWAPVVSSLQNGLITPPVLSKYASQAARLSNASFIRPTDLSTSFLQSDILGVRQEELSAVIGYTPTLITFFFTLNGLRSKSSARTAALLLKITLAAPRDSFLLIIDNPEQSSDTAGVDEAGKEITKPQLGKFLDLVLMEKAISMGDVGNPACAWKEVKRDENRVFRLEQELKFPISLDNVRFQLYMFKKR